MAPVPGSTDKPFRARWLKNGANILLLGLKVLNVYSHWAINDEATFVKLGKKCLALKGQNRKSMLLVESDFSELGRCVLLIICQVSKYNVSWIQTVKKSGWRGKLCITAFKSQN